MKNTIGVLLHNLREDKNISQEQLGRGICSVPTLSRYEYEERVPDILTLNALFERMGKSMDKIGVYVSQDEYEYLLLRREALDYMETGDADKIKSVLKLLKKTTAKVNKNIKEQFEKLLEAFLAYLDNRLEDCRKLLETAVLKTVPEFNVNQLKGNLFSSLEIQLLLLLSDIYIKECSFGLAEDLLSNLEKIITAYYDDAGSRVKVYPKTIRLYSYILIKKERYAECMVFCDKAIELLREQGILYDLAELMEAYVTCSSHGYYTEKTDMYRLQARVLRDSYKEAGVEMAYKNPWKFFQNQELLLIHEMLGQCRRSKEMTHEVASEGICTPETLSRVENGRRTPRKESFKALMEKYEQDGEIYQTGLCVSDFHIIELNKQLDLFISDQRWQEAEKLLNKIKKRLDETGEITEKHNQKIIRYNEACILYNLDKLDLDDFRIICEELLGIDSEGWKDERFWIKPLMGIDSDILNGLAMIFCRRDELEKATYIWKNMFRWIEKSHNRYEDRYQSSAVIIQNLCYAYYVSRKNDACIQMIKKGIGLCLRSGRSSNYAMFWGNLAEAMEGISGINKQSKKYMFWSYVIGEIFNEVVHINNCIQYIIDQYNIIFFSNQEKMYCKNKWESLDSILSECSDK